MDVLSDKIRNENPWELLYANDPVITEETDDEFQRRVRE